MQLVKWSLLVLGGMALCTGLIWVGQGTGYFPYPRASFMISQMPWAYRGAVTAMCGVAAMAASRFIKRR